MRTKNYLALGAVLLTACAGSIVGVGCSGDSSVANGQDAGPDSPEPTPDTGTPDTSLPDTAVPDTGTHVDGAPFDTGTPDTSVPDSGHDSGGTTDSGPDTGSSDAGQDTGAQDSGTDTGTPDTGTEDGSTDGGAEGGETDASDASSGDASSSDASDASEGDSGDASDGATDSGDAAAPVSFNNPVQIDVSAIFNARTVVTTAPTTGASLTLVPMDGTGNNDDFPTQAFVDKLPDSGPVFGLPNNGSFAATGTSIPALQLAWNDSRNTQQDSLVIAGSPQTPFTFLVPAGKYTQVQLLATGGNGSATLAITLHYATGADTTFMMTLPDWCVPGTLGTDAHTLVGVDRIIGGTTLDSSHICSIYALDLNPDSSRDLIQVGFTDQGGTSNYLVFYGAVAW